MVDENGISLLCSGPKTQNLVTLNAHILKVFIKHKKITHICNKNVTDMSSKCSTGTIYYC